MSVLSQYFPAAWQHWYYTSEIIAFVSIKGFIQLQMIIADKLGYFTFLQMKVIVIFKTASSDHIFTRSSVRTHSKKSTDNACLLYACTVQKETDEVGQRSSVECCIGASLVCVKITTLSLPSSPPSFAEPLQLQLLSTWRFHDT